MMIQGFTHNIVEQPIGALASRAIGGVLAADVVFGSPNRNCAGSGICRVTAPIAQEMQTIGSWGCHRAIALVRLAAPQVLAFHFVIQSMCRKAMEQHFSAGFFLVEAPFEFKPDFWAKGQGIIVPPGAYPIVRSQDYLTVNFNTEIRFENNFLNGL